MFTCLIHETHLLLLVFGAFGWPKQQTACEFALARNKKMGRTSDTGCLRWISQEVALDECVKLDVNNKNMGHNVSIPGGPKTKLFVYLTPT